MAEIKIDYTKIRNPQVRDFLEKNFKDVLFSIIDGHDHNGTNSKTLSPAAVVDPGNGQAIAVANSGTCPLVSAGAETRTLAAPTFAGQRIILACKTYVGDITLTASAAVNQTGNNTLVFGAAGDYIELVGIELGAAKVWRVVANDGVALSTVA